MGCRTSVIWLHGQLERGVFSKWDRQREGARNGEERVLMAVVEDFSARLEFPCNLIALFTALCLLVAKRLNRVGLPLSDRASALVCILLYELLKSCAAFTRAFFSALLAASR